MIRKKIRKKIQEDTVNDPVSTPYGKTNSSLRPVNSFLKSLVILKIFALADHLGLQETIYRPREELYNTNLTSILLFFGSCDISTMKSNFSLQVYFAVVEGSDEMGNFEVRKSDLSKSLDGRIKLNFSTIHRDITGTSFLYESPARFNESHRLKPQKPGGKGGQLPLMQIIAG